MTANHCAAQRSIDVATQALTRGGPVLIAHGDQDQRVADVMIAAAQATPKSTAWLIKYSSGLLCAAMPGSRADHLELPPMARSHDPARQAPQFAVAVDAAEGIGTGISATDRACTARVLATSASRPDDLVRPGHVLPIRTAAYGVLSHRSSHEAAVDLCSIAGLPPVGLSAALLGNDGAELRGPAVLAFAQAHDVPMVCLEDVVHHRLYHGDPVLRRVRAVREDTAGSVDRLPGAWPAVLFEDPMSADNPMVYVLTECS
ncbi:MAG: 3,4-dihydroxy-2-butanone-4-phosphate synthase [Mycobacterium sp.]